MLMIYYLGLGGDKMRQGNWTFEQLEKHYYVIDTIT